ncbi:hypothetical protein C5167_039959 [Papaver somniferum]|uniref:CASP-like protein n=1 Tax=Papaver somniferum TaxID=3469 RepID=A0A4Y7IH41_PAPSO|nr:CASP-like protein Ni6 [Papaver somniferum]RZC47031.1 hypothetical protein C5167_039959 [Papaver somniferum]
MSTEELLRPATADASSVETGGVSNIIDGSDDLEAAVQIQSSFISLAASLGMRKLLFWTVFVASIVIHTSKQTVDDISGHGGTSKTTKYTQYSSYTYLLSVLWIVFVYTFLACLTSFFFGRLGNKAFLLKLLKWDAMMLTLLASATGTAGAVLVIASKGNPHDEWSKTCNVFDKFCRHMWASFGLSIFACSLFVWIIVYSAGAIRAP